MTTFEAWKDERIEEARRAAGTTSPETTTFFASVQDGYLVVVKITTKWVQGTRVVRRGWRKEAIPTGFRSAGPSEKAEVGRYRLPERVVRLPRSPWTDIQGEYGTTSVENRPMFVSEAAACLGEFAAKCQEVLGGE